VENVLARLRPLIPSGPKNEIPTDTLPHAVNEVDLSFKLILGIFGWHIRLPSPNELIELPQPNPISPGRLGLFSEAVLYMGKVLDQFAANPLLKKKIAALDEPETNERKKEHWEKPFWDSERGELRFKERRIKKYKQRAPNHRVILDAFQSQGWPPRIDNPFDHKKQLDETIQGMNRGIRKICFERDGTGEGVLWKLR
jgi:hypothetical protein